MKHKVILLHNHDNTWTPADLIEVAEDNRLVMEALRSHGCEVTDVKVYHSVEHALREKNYSPREWIVFNWCEGYADRPWDYAGVVDELEHLKYAYTGSTAWTLRMTQDKRTTRSLLRGAGVPTPLGLEARQRSQLRWSRYPAIVKPVNQHGSYGIDEQAVVESDRQLRQRVEYVLDTFHCPALIEEFVAGRELLVTVLGNEVAGPLPAVEVVFRDQIEPGKQIYSYDMKFSPNVWLSHGVRFICPPMLTVEARQRVEAVCLRAYRAVHGRDYARFDVRLRDDQPYIVDVNPNPDINSESAVTMSAQFAGLTYPELIVRLADLAAERHKPAVSAGVLRPQPQTVTRLPRVLVP
ncbi:MAG TPA: ATP-grasp domain-containing protein [Anaerolineae bacterium]|nr:ATP-grasp domain-containing protein [Anaerolineae bacterium]